MTLPAQRCMDYLKGCGWQYAKVERWNPHAPRGDGEKGLRQDLWGFGDMIACRPLEAADGRPGGVMLIQASGESAHGKHVTRIVTNEKLRFKARNWLMAGGLLEVWSFRKTKGNRRYQLRRTPITLARMGWAEEAQTRRPIEKASVVIAKAPVLEEVERSLFSDLK